MKKLNKISYIIGVDEAWRWPWMWPVTAVSLCFNPINPPIKSFIKTLDDSKKLNEKKREEIFTSLIEMSQNQNPEIFFWLWMVDNFLIDEINIRQANKEAMRRSLIELLRKVDKKKIKEVLIDWRDNYDFEELKEKPIYIIWWDWKIPEIWAASIIAKVFRDKIMKTYSLLYPDYWIENHKWYGTKKHSDKIKNKNNILWIHRISYKPIKLILDK